MNINEFKQWARAMLGADCVKVELSETQLKFALDNAKDWWNSYFGLFKEATLSLVVDQAEYDMSGVTPGIDKIVKVWFPKQVAWIDFREIYPGFLDVHGIPYGMNVYGQYPQGTIVQSLITIEGSQKILSFDNDWEFYSDNTTDPKTRILRLMPPVKEGGDAVYMYRIDPEDIKLKHYQERDLYLIREWALAEAKYMLGRIRGKYKGLPAAGGERTLDGDDLIQESIADKERLRQEVLGRSAVMPMVY